MPPDHLIGDGEPALMNALGAFDAGFFTDPPDPLHGAGWLVAGFPAAATFKPPGIDVLPSPEKRPEDGDFFERGEVCSYGKGGPHGVK